MENKANKSAQASVIYSCPACGSVLEIKAYFDPATGVVCSISVDKFELASFPMFAGWPPLGLTSHECELPPSDEPLPNGHGSEGEQKNHPSDQCREEANENR